MVNILYCFVLLIFYVISAPWEALYMYFVLLNLLLLSVLMIWRRAHVYSACVWKSEDNYVELVLFHYSMDPKDWTKVFRFAQQIPLTTESSLLFFFTICFLFVLCRVTFFFSLFYYLSIFLLLLHCTSFIFTIITTHFILVCIYYTNWCVSLWEFKKLPLNIKAFIILTIFSCIFIKNNQILLRYIK